LINGRGAPGRIEKETVGMSSEEAVVGKRVKVRPEHRREELRGASGTIRQRYGAPEYVALEVDLGRGRNELFWHFELEACPE
jgi:hypothetical protein